MNAGQAITAGMRAQRRRDLIALCRDPWLLHHHDLKLFHRFQAWLWWGWNINGKGGTGIPGATFPWWTEPRYLRRHT